MWRCVGSPPLRAPTLIADVSAFWMCRNLKNSRRYGLRHMLADVAGRTRISAFSIVSLRKLPPLRAPTLISDVSACGGGYTDQSEKSPPLRAPTLVFDVAGGTRSKSGRENNRIMLIYQITGACEGCI